MLPVEEVLLDLNLWEKEHKFLGLGAFSVSDDGRWLAYTLDTTGFRQYTLHVRDLTSGQEGPEDAARVGSVAWGADNATIFYTVEDAAKRQYRLYRHTMGGSNAGDELLYEEKDERFSVDIGRSLSRAYLFLTSGSHTQSEVRYLATNQPAGQFKLIAARETGHEYYVAHHGDRFFIRTNQGAPNFRLVSAPVTDPGKASWKEVIPHRPDVMLSGMTFFANHYVLIERDPVYREASTARSAGGIRQQFSTPENIAMSQFTLSLFRRLRTLFGPDADVAFREQGYLIMATDEGAAVLAELSALGLLLSEINGRPAADHPIARHLEQHGFSLSPHGYQVRRA